MTDTNTSPAADNLPFLSKRRSASCRSGGGASSLSLKPSKREVLAYSKDRQRSKHELRALLMRAQEGKCARCNIMFKRARVSSGHARRATLDHVTPKSKGGTNQFSNFVLLCRKCNVDVKGSNIDTALVAYAKRLWARIDAEVRHD